MAAPNDVHDSAAAGGDGRRHAAQLISDICQALIDIAPDYSVVHEDLAPVLSKSRTQDMDLFDHMLNNNRCHATVEGVLESLNLGGYSLDRIDKKLGVDLANAVFLHGLNELHLSGNSFRTIKDGLGWLVVDEDVAAVEKMNGDGKEDGEQVHGDIGEGSEPTLSSIFLDANIIREVDWPPVSLVAVRGCLKHLDLSKNKLRFIDVVAAPLPQPITLHGLEWLDLSGNIKLSALPVGFFPSVPNLRRFDAYSCALESIPEDICVCKQLMHCGLHSNELTMLPAELFMCDKIVWLSLNMNKLEYLPENIGDLKNLKRLSLHMNSLRTIPASIADCTQLEALSIHRNSLTSLPDSMSSLKECSRLSLYENPGLKCVPDGVCGMTGLKELWLNECGLTSLNKNIGNLHQLQRLQLDMNPGMIIDDTAWEALKRLDLHELYLDGQVPVTEKEQRAGELRAAMAQLKKLYL